MDVSKADNLARKINLDLKTWGMQCGFIIAYHPLDYCKTLVQIGYEPYAPVESWFFGSTYLGLPNMFQYVKYVKSVDGFFGVYRGLLPRLCGSTVSSIVYNTLAKRTAKFDVDSNIDDIHGKEGEQSEIQIGKVSTYRSTSWVRADSRSDSDIPAFLKKTALEIVCVTGSTVAAHPFHVIAVRTMAQFVGRESKYTSIWSSILEIYNNEGIKGFFSGLVPRLVGDVIYISISATIIYLACRNFGKNKLTDQAASMTGNMIASSFSYPFQVVSNTMIVNNSGLAIGRMPYTRTYDDWLDAYKSLKVNKQIKRGSSLIGRAYAGPTYFMDGKLKPFGFYFGPAHLPGMGYKPKLELEHSSALLFPVPTPPVYDRQGR